jgi:methylphosphotriester-DNA--protein-cysteine methyltransferase
MTDSWTLTDPDGSPYQSERPGVLGGHRRSKIYGRLECRSALQALARGGYAGNRVFFLDEHAAQAAGYRPCAVCLPAENAAWKAARHATASTHVGEAQDRLQRSDRTASASGSAPGSPAVLFDRADVSGKQSPISSSMMNFITTMVRRSGATSSKPC